MVHCASEIMRWGSLINCSGEAAEEAHKINVKGPGTNTNHHEGEGGTFMTHAQRKGQRDSWEPPFKVALGSNKWY